MKHQFDPFNVQYEAINAPVLDFRTECILTALKVVSLNTRNSPIAVMMSGGLDSEIIAESFLAAGIPFKCVIAKLEVQVANEIITLNAHDYEYAEKWCSRHAIQVEYCHIDIYAEARLLTEYALGNKAFSPQFACHMYMMKWCNDNGYFFVTGFGQPEVAIKDDVYCFVERQREFSLESFVETFHLDGIVRFWTIDSNIKYSFLKLNTVQKLMAEKVPQLEKYKVDYYLEAFPWLEKREKFTGFEKIQEWDAVLRTSMKRINGKYDSLLYTPISVLR